ncbi:MAG: adenine deaminase [Firmicutes bacterium]|nr:adenine deaminase [Bacillota bacterium]
MSLQERTALIRTALGSEKADLAIVNGTLVNVYTGELLERYGVAVKGKRIAYVGKDIGRTIGSDTEVIDAAGKYLVPGFIDTHAHMCFYCSASEFLRYSMRGGTTTIVTELIEMSFPLGYRGIVEYLESCRDQPVKVFGVIPPMLTPSSGALSKAISKEQLRELLKRDDVLGLGEAYWLPTVEQDGRLLELFEETLRAGKIVAGHSAGAKGNKLVAYAASGATSCHEPITMEEVVERLRLGMYVLAREGETRQDLKVIAKIREMNLDLRRMALVTDGIPLKELVEKGHMEAVLQKAIDFGFDPVSAIQMVTLNAAEYLNLDDRIGGIAPGKDADIVIIPDLHNISAEYVISNGRIIARHRELLVQPRKHLFPEWTRRSIRLTKKYTPEDFLIRVADHVDSVEVRVIDQVTELVTKEATMTVPLSEGMIKAEPERDLLKISAIDFQANPGKQFVGLIRGLKMKKGALASSMAWDLTNIIAVGADEADLALAVNRIIEMQGGVVACADGRILAELQLPVGAYLSDAPIEELLRKSEKLQQAAFELGFPFANVNLTLMTLTSPAIPFVRICEDGLFDVRTNKRVDFIIK